MMAKKRIWISFDLGVTGDYDRLYGWLDEHEAVECGNGFATLEYEFKNYTSDYKDLFAELRHDLAQYVEDTPKTRIYVLTVAKDLDTPGGTFIFGKRKANLWEGYAPKEETIDR